MPVLECTNLTSNQKHKVESNNSQFQKASKSLRLVPFPQKLRVSIPIWHHTREHKPLFWQYNLQINELTWFSQIHHMFYGTAYENRSNVGCLGGSVGWASDFGSGRDLMVRGFEPHMGLCADRSEPGACFGFCVSLSLCPSPVHALSLSLSKINKREKYFLKRWENTEIPGWTPRPEAFNQVQA